MCAPRRDGGRNPRPGKSPAARAQAASPHLPGRIPRPARWLTITAHGQFERFVRAFGRQPTRPGLPDPSGPPTPEQAAALAAACRNYGIEIVGPPLL